MIGMGLGLLKSKEAHAGDNYIYGISRGVVFTMDETNYQYRSTHLNILRGVIIVRTT